MNFVTCGIWQTFFAATLKPCLPTKCIGSLNHADYRNILQTPFQPYHLMPCISKGSKVILTFDPFDMLQHTLHWIGMVRKV